jgi:hypothetical protein
VVLFNWRGIRLVRHAHTFFPETAQSGSFVPGQGQGLQERSQVVN